MSASQSSSSAPTIFATEANPEQLHHLAEKLAQSAQQIRQQLQRCIIGQEQTIEHLLITLFSKGHALFVGAPGLGKTLLIRCLAQTLGLRFNRIQFTPDLMPSDITGSDVLDEDDKGKRYFRFLPGPVFCDLLLADEINRTPPKTQSALLEAMQEGRVTASGQSHPLGKPFHVFATQNPIEQEGTYPLPEAQLDRFSMMLLLDYPSLEEEIHIAQHQTQKRSESIEKVLEPEQLVLFQSLVPQVPIAAHLLEYTVKLIRSTRPSPQNGRLEDSAKKSTSTIDAYISYGAGPRASQHLIMAAKARALLHGRYAVDISDIHDLWLPTLRHRVLLNFQAQASNIHVDSILEELLRKATAS